MSDNSNNSVLAALLAVLILVVGFAIGYYICNNNREPSNRINIDVPGFKMRSDR